MRRAATALALTLTMGCAEAPIPPEPSAAPVAQLVKVLPAGGTQRAAKTQTLKTQTLKTQTLKTQAPKTQTPIQRFAARATVPLPLDVPPAWGKLVRDTDGRLRAVEHETRTRVDGAPPYRTLTLTWAMFGPDAEVEARLLKALTALKLPGLEAGLPKAPVRRGPIYWALEVERYKAPMTAARESKFTLRWTRTPATVAELPKCRTLPELAAPAGTPRWLARVTNKMSTRRRVAAAVSHDDLGHYRTMHMLYRNGEAHDEGIGQLSKAAKRAGFVKAGGGGIKQQWRHKSGARLRWGPRRSLSHLGCTPRGPVLEIEIQAP